MVPAVSVIEAPWGARVAMPRPVPACSRPREGLLLDVAYQLPYNGLEACNALNVSQRQTAQGMGSERWMSLEQAQRRGHRTPYRCGLATGAGPLIRSR